MKKNLSDYLVALSVIACSIVLLAALTFALSGYRLKKPTRTLQIQSYYQTMLHHAASQADVTYWLSQFRAGLNEAGVLAGFLASSEYFLLSHQYP